MEERQQRKPRMNRRPRRKVCAFCAEKATSVDYKDVAVDFLAHSDAWGGEEEALWLLVEQGYQNEEIYPDTGQVIQEAKFQRALLKNVED